MSAPDLEPRGRLSDDQLRWLLQPLRGDRVFQKDGHHHLTAWDVRRTLTRVFGFGGWDEEVVLSELVHAASEERQKRRGDGTYTAWTVIYRAVIRLTVRDPEGRTVARYEGAATGDAVNQPAVGDAHDLAMKAAHSQALKRAAINLGDGFGLSLYSGGLLDPVVKFLPLAHKEPADDAPVDDRVTSMGADDGAVEPGDDDAARAAADAAHADDGLDAQDPPPWTQEGARRATATAAEEATAAAVRLARVALAADSPEALGAVWAEAGRLGVRQAQVTLDDGAATTLEDVVRRANRWPRATRS